MRTSLSADDLRLIADNLDQWNEALVNSDGYKPLADLIRWIPITRPGSFDNKVIGDYILEDGWVGVKFNGEG